MNSVSDSLMALQSLHFKKNAANRAEQIATLRTQIPENLLQILDRFLSRGKKAVSIVRHAVCGECHLRLPVGTVGALAFGQEVQTCGNCGRFLFLPPDESIVATKTKKTKAATSTKTVIAHAE